MDEGKRRLQPDGMSGTSQTPCKKQKGTPSKEQELLFEMKKMLNAKEKLPETRLTDLLRTKINDLETEKREIVGIFGRIGSGKSSLINAVIGEKDLLPSGDISACTTVIIKVEANMENWMYEAETEFLPLKDATDVVRSLKKTALARDDSDGEDDSDDDDDDDDDDDEDDDKSDAIEELSRLYGENWEQICSHDDFMNKKHFRQIPELFSSGKKTMAFYSAGELSRELIKYTRGRSQGRAGEDGKRFWPLVKCVTIRVPNNDFLQYVTLVDLPGTGDNNKTRHNMWKDVVGNCSTVWIVTDIIRSTADKEAWDILKRASSLIGNGGQCQHIHFICTKSDSSGLSNNSSAAILQRNKDAKEAVMRKLSTQKILRNNFPDECFQVFTVSAKEFHKKQYLDPVDTEIPKLHEFLRSLNDRHSETLNYVRGAKGILSLIQGARAAKVSGNEEAVCRELKENLAFEQEIVQEAMNEAYEAFDSCLRTGVEKSLSLCDYFLKSFLNPKGKGKGSGFHMIPECVIIHNSAYITREGEILNLNETLASCLKESIDKEFSRTFPNLQGCEPFNGAIKSFTLETDTLLEKYKDVTGMQLRLKYLSTEEEQMKINLNKTIRDRKKLIYNSLVTAIEENMAPCYDKAKQCKGKGTLENMKTIIKDHFEVQKNVMFEEAKDKMMSELRKLMDNINKTLEEHMKEAIEHSLKTDFESFPDVSQELDKVTDYYNQLKEKKRTSLLRSPEQTGPSNA